MTMPSGRAMHNGKMYELWGDELWEYSPDVETGETTVRVVGQLGILPTTDSLRDAAADLLDALEIAVASGKSWHGISAARAAIAKAKRLSTPTGNPKYPDSPIGYCEDSDSLHECSRDRNLVGIHECGLAGCHLPEDKA